MKLRPLITNENKNTLIIVAYTVFLILYCTTNRFFFRDPSYLPLTIVDRAIPFMPWTLWIYLSDFVYLVIVAIIVRDLRSLNILLYSFYIVLIMHICVFAVYPTIYPRPTMAPDGFMHWVYRIYWKLDAPTNCFPSLHVSLVMLGVFILKIAHRQLLWPFGIWAFLICLSTMTAKQHYFADVMGGLATAIVAFTWTSRRLR